MTPVAIDTETTGMADDDEIVEIAAVRGPEDFSTEIVRPESRPISWGAMATHHITQEKVDAEGLRLADALREIGLDLPMPGTVLVMHNAAYDRKYLPPYLQDLPFVCTYRCALHLCPDAESHSNGALWYELGLSHPLPEEAGSMPHRALFDALMTWDLLYEFLLRVADRNPEDGAIESSRNSSIQRLVDMTQEPVLLKKVRFGKHQGSRWGDVPVDYLQWVLRQDFDSDVVHTARHWIKNGG